MARLEMTVSVTWRWWLKPYILTLAFFCAITGLQPDWQKFSRMVVRGLKVEVGGRRYRMVMP